MVGAVPASASSMRSSILPPSRPQRGDAGGVVAGEPVVHRPGGAVEAAAVHRADDDLVLERAEQQQLLDDVGGAEHAVDVGVAQRLDQPGEQRAPVGHRHRVAAGGQRPARRVVGGDQEERAALGEQPAGRRRAA